MKVITTSLALFFVFSFISAEMMRNIDYLSFGYDLYKGNPLSTSSGVDPGFQIQKIFKFTYSEQQKSSDGRWDIPDHTTVVREDSCNLGFTSTSISGSESYSHTLENFISAEVSGWGAKFKGSVDYKSVEERTSKYKELYTTSRGECKIYTGRIDTYKPPKLADNFIDALNTLPEEYNENQYLEFIWNYGTHFVNQVHMGARFTCVTRLTENAWTTLLQKNIKVDIAASFSAFGVTGAAETRTEDQKKMAKEFDSVKTEMTLSIVGAKPIKEHGPIEWAQQVIEEPMPMRYTLEPLYNLFTERYVQDSKVIRDIRVLKANMERAMQKYCDYSVRRGVLNDCKAPPPDPPFPKVVNACRWCAGGCGGMFPLAVGGLISWGNMNPAPHYAYDGACNAPFGRRGFTGLAMLCCQAEDDTRHGQCRFCNSCGDDFPEDNGAANFGQDNIPTTAFDNACHGELRPRGHYARLCCKPRSICSWCTSCGGDFPEESGIMTPTKISIINFKVLYSGRGDRCQGSFRGEVGAARICCRTRGVSSVDEVEFADNPQPTN